MISAVRQFKELIWGGKENDISCIDSIVTLYREISVKVQKSSEELQFNDDWIKKLNDYQTEKKCFPNSMEFIKLITEQSEVDAQVEASDDAQDEASEDQASDEASDDASDDSQDQASDDAALGDSASGDASDDDVDSSKDEFEDAVQELNDDDYFVDSLDHFVEVKQFQGLELIYQKYIGWDNDDFSQNVINFGRVTEEFIEYFISLFETDQERQTNFIRLIYHDYSKLIFNCNSCGYNQFKFCEACPLIKKIITEILIQLQQQHALDTTTILVADQGNYIERIDFLKSYRRSNINSFIEQLQLQLLFIDLPNYLSYLIIDTYQEQLDSQILEIFQLREPSYIDYLQKPIQTVLQLYHDQQDQQELSQLDINVSSELKQGAQNFLEFYVKQIKAHQVDDNRQFFKETLPMLIKKAYELIGEYSSTIVTLTDNNWYEIQQLKKQQQNDTAELVNPIDIIRLNDSNKLKVLFRQLMDQIQTISDAQNLQKFKRLVKNQFQILKINGRVKASRMINICVDDQLDGQEAQRWEHISSQEHECFYIQWCSKESTLEWIKKILIQEVKSNVQANVMKFIGQYFSNSSVRVDYLFQINKKLKIMGRFLSKAKSAYYNSYFYAQESGLLLAYLICYLDLFQGAQLNFYCQSLGSVLVQSCLIELNNQNKLDMVENVWITNGMESRGQWQSSVIEGIRGSFYNFYDPFNWRLKLFKYSNSKVKDPSGLGKLSIKQKKKVHNINLQIEKGKSGKTSQQKIEEILLKNKFSQIFE